MGLDVLRNAAFVIPFIAAANFSNVLHDDRAVLELESQGHSIHRLCGKVCGKAITRTKHRKLLNFIRIMCNSNVEMARQERVDLLKSKFIQIFLNSYI